MYSAEKFAAVRRLFPHTRQTVYFNAASYGPFATTVQRTIDRNLELRMRADRDDTHATFADLDALRSIYARLIGARKREVGVGLNTSFGLNLAAFGLPLKKGDEVLISDVEFPAVAYTWRAAAEQRGLRIKFVPSVDRCFDLDLLERTIGKRTRVVSVSWVQFFNGFKVDLAELSELCQRKGLYLVVDGIQGMGVEPINLKRIKVDVFTSGCQKWMLSPQGCGFFYLSDRVRDTMKHPWMSWLGVDWKATFTDLFRYDLPWFDSAQRFELGYYAILNILGMRAAAEFFTGLGIGNIRKHNYGLIDRLVAFLDSEPFYAVTSSMERRHRSSIVTFTCADYKQLHRELLRKKIILVQREGSVRASIHLYNNEADIDRTIKVLRSFAKKHRG